MNLEDARKRKDLSQYQMAVKLGVTERTWRRWENLESGLPANILPKLQAELGLSDSEVLNIVKHTREAS